MGKILLLFWTSVIVVLNVRGDATNNVYSKICEQCNNATLPACPIMDPLPDNMTRVNCQQLTDKLCTIGIVEAGVEIKTDYICLLSPKSTLINISSEDGINVISLIKEPLSAMLPFPLEMQSTTVNAPLHEPVPNDSKDNAETTMHTTAASEVPEITTKSAPGSDSDNQIGDSIIAEMLTTATEIAETDTNQQKEVEQLAAAEETNPTPSDSLDYQGDAPHSEVGLVDVATAVTIDENKIEVEKIVKPAEGDVIKDLQILVKPNKEITSAVMDANEQIMNTPAGSGVDIEKLDKGTETSSTNVIGDNSITAETVESIATEMQTCYSCTSTDDKSCVTKPPKEISCKTLDGSKNGCYTLFQGSEIQRGCSNELATSELNACNDETNQTCLLCAGVACNNAPWPQCYSCHSQQSQPACAWWSEEGELNDANQHWMTLCPGSDDICISYIDSNGGTVRGCASLNEQCARVDQALCETCESAFCNAGVFPKTRRRCHQCEGTTDCAAQQTQDRALACPIYRTPDIEEGCFFYVNNNGKMHRGCTSSRKQFEACRAYISGDKRCVNCTHGDACNSTPLMVEPTLACSRCDSRQNDAATTPGCAWAQAPESVTTCHKRYLYYLEESCQMIYQPDVELTMRDCSLDVGACEATNPWCRTCNSSACNTVNLKWEYCLQCRSDDTSSCDGDAASMAPTQCGADVQPYATRGCYTSRNVETNVTARGCIADLSEEGMKYCKTHSKLCALCYEHGCNNRLASSGSATRVGDFKAFLAPLCIFIIIMASFLKTL